MRFITKHHLYLLTFILSVCAKSAADISTDTKVIIAYADAHIELKQSAKAIERITKELNNRPQNPVLWDYLANIYLKDNQYDKAASAFGEAAKYSDKEKAAVYKYQQASAEAKAGKVNEAKNSLAEAAKSPVVKPSAEKAMMHIKSGTALPEIVPDHPGKWKASGYIKTGYDDNVLLFSESTLATAQRTDTASAVTSPSIEVAYDKPTGYGALSNSLSLNTQIYANKNAKAYDSINAMLRSNLAKDKPQWLGLVHSFNNTLKTSFLDSDNYKQQSIDDTIQWLGRKYLSANESLTYGQSVRYQNYIQSVAAEDSRTGFALKPEVNYANKLDDLSYSAGLSYERLFAQGDNFKSDAFSVPLGLQKSFNESLNGSLGLSYTYTQYPSSSTKRKDGNVSANVSIQQAFSKTTAAAIEYSYTKNASNLSTGEYNRQTIELKVTSEIQ